MPNDFSRSERVGDTLQRELASLIQHEVRDPRVGMVNINAVRVSRDLRSARIFVTYVEQLDEQAIQQSIQVLNKAAGFLRSKLHNRIIMRVMPQLHFEYDESIMRAAHLTDLIDAAVKTDRQHAEAREQDGAQGERDQEAESGPLQNRE